MLRACAELPDGLELHVCLEAGAGWSEFTGLAGARIELEEDTDGGMTPRIHAAIDFAVKADARLEELSRE
jgi:hypothetical protein